MVCRKQGTGLSTLFSPHSYPESVLIFPRKDSLEMRQIFYALFLWYSCDSERLSNLSRVTVSLSGRGEQAEDQGNHLIKLHFPWAPMQRAFEIRLLTDTDGLDWFWLTWVLPGTLLLTITLLRLTFQNFPSINASNNMWLHASQGWEDKWSNKGENQMSSS